MKNAIKLAVYAGVGLYDKVKEEVDELVQRGELKQQEGKALVEAVEERERGRIRDLTKRIEDGVKHAVDRLPPVAVKRELESIDEHLRDLEARVGRLEIASIAESEDLNITPS
jgi:polyhydroxyalkanoate synthesis regulator phasin